MCFSARRWRTRERSPASSDQRFSRLALAGVAWVVAATIIGLNGWLLIGTFTAWL